MRTNLFVTTCLIAAAIVLPFSVWKIFLDTPIEAQMGTAQKIFYFHVPLAWVFMLLTVVAGVASGVELKKGSVTAQALALSCGEVAALAGFGVLVTGPIWGDATWGKPWTGDARQVTTALLWLMSCSYLLLRKYGPSNAERMAAGLAVVAAALVPIVHYSVKVWRTLHPNTTVVGSLPPELRTTLWLGVLSMLLISVAMVCIRYALERQSQTLDEAWIALDRKVGQESKVN